MLNIPGYRLEKQIGQGGMATVYLAVQESLDRPVALKILNNPSAPGFSERFLREGRFVAAIKHAHIATIYDIGIHNDTHYISMEYITGGDLKQRIREGIEMDFAIDLTIKLGSALQAAHALGVVHRDVKPTNILFRDDQTPVLMDFGIARQYLSSGELTATGELLGSPHYLSPEQAQNMTLDGRADIYSLGIVLYEMLVGEKPYHGDSDVSVIFQQVYEPLPKLPRVYANLQPLLDRMTAKDPQQRFKDIGQALESFDDMSRPNGTIGKLGLAEHAHTVPQRRWSLGGRGIANIFDLAQQKMFAFHLTALLLIVATILYVTHLALQLNTEGSIAANRADQSAETTSDKEASLAIHAPITGSDERVASLDTTTPRSKKATGLSTGEPAVIDRIGSERIENYISFGDARLRDNMLTTPDNDSALFYYQQALKLDPHSAEAYRGMTRIADRYAVLAKQQISSGNLLKARHYIDTGLEVEPSHSRLRALNRRIKIQTGSKRIVRRVESFIKDMKDKIEN